MQSITAQQLFASYLGHDASIVAFVRQMQQYGLTPDDVLALHAQYLDDLQATMLPAPVESPEDVPVELPPDPDPDTRRPEGQADTEYRLGACPRCGGEVWGIKKCPHVAPPWRTFVACDNDACGFHGRSRLTVDVLRRQWPTGVEED